MGLGELECALERFGRLPHLSGGEQGHPELDVQRGGAGIVPALGQDGQPSPHPVDRLPGPADAAQGVTDLGGEPGRLAVATESLEAAGSILEQLERGLVATVEERHVGGGLDQRDPLVVVGGELDRPAVGALGAERRPDARRRAGRRGAVRSPPRRAAARRPSPSEA